MGRRPIRRLIWPALAAVMLAVSIADVAARDSPVDYGRELRWFEAAASDGDREAQYRLGLFHERGIKTDPNPEVARQWYAKAAWQGHKLAQFRLASLLWEGIGGPADIPEAARWFRSAALQGIAQAQFNLAVILDQGIGLDANPTEAAQLYEAAAISGITEAAVNLAMLYLDGRGVAEDPVSAYAWLLVAREMGYDGVGSALLDVSRRLDGSQLNRAQAKAAQIRVVLPKATLSDSE